MSTHFIYFFLLFPQTGTHKIFEEPHEFLHQTEGHDNTAEPDKQKR